MTHAASFSPNPIRELPADRLARWAMSLIAVLHMLVFLWFALVLATATPARAEDDLSCGARDRMAELEKDNPSEYAKLRLEGDKIANAQARFWKLEKAGQSPDWLLGTFHLSDPRVTNLPEAAKAAYRKSSTIILESDEILDQKTASARLMAKPGLMFFMGSETLKDHMSAEDQKVVSETLGKRGVSFASMIKFKPWILSSMISLSTCEIARKNGGAAFLDMKLAKDAAKAGKTVVGLETLAEQIEAMNSLPIEFHVRSLVAAARYPDYTADMMETTLGLYLRGEIGLVFPAAAYFAPEKGASDLKDMALFEQKLITERNHNMADRAAKTLAKGDVFMAVGALHLIGDEGLVALLRKQGYTVTPIF